MSNIVVLTGSQRVGGNTDILAQAFAEGARQKGHTVEILSVAEYKVHPCTGCNRCFEEPAHACVQEDDMAAVYEKLSHADMLVVASPVYFYGLSAQVKAIVDRLHNPIRDSFPIRKLGLILVGGATLPELFDAILTEYRLVLNFFHLEDGGKVLVRGARAKGAVKGTDAEQEAFAFGASL